MNWIVQSIIMIYFVAMFALGILGERHTKDTNDYYVAGRRVNGIYMALVYITSLVSAGALVGWSSQGWQWGIFIIYAACAVTVASFLCWWFLGRKLMICSKQLELVTVPDFMEIRFESRAARLLASLILICFSVPMLVSQFKAIGILFNVTTGLSYDAAVICFGVIVFLYVAFGGYIAVIYTDCVQGFLMLAGVFTLMIAVIRRVGNSPVSQYIALNPAGSGSWPTADSAVTPTLLISFILLNFFGALGAPNYIRGFYSMRDNKAYKQGFTITITVLVVLEIIMALLGVYGKIVFPQIDSPDNIIYYMIESLLPPFLAGITLAALAAAVMSTVDSLLIQCASTVENDILTRTFHLNLSEDRRIRIAKGTVAVIGLICVLWGLNPPEYLALLMYPAWGAMGICFAWVFFLGLYWKRFNKAGALTAMATSAIVFSLWNALGNPFGIYHIQMALLISAPATIIVTLLTPKTSQQTLAKFF